MSNKHIAFFHVVFPYGGAEIVTSRISKYLIENGYKISMFVIDVDKSKLFSGHPDIDYIKLPDKDFSSSENATIITNVLNEQGIDVLIIPGFFLDNLEYIRNNTQCKLVFSNHSMPFWEIESKMIIGKEIANKSLAKFIEWYLLRVPKYKLLGSLCQKNYDEHANTYKFVDAYTVLCDDYGKRIARKINIKYEGSKLYTLTNPTVEPENVVLEKKKQVIYAGRLTYSEKRVDRLLDVWSRIYKDFPDWEFLIIGEGEESDRLKRQAADLGLKNIRFCGYTSDVISYYQDAAILCLASPVEAWGLVLTEAQSYGVVPIAFGCSAGVKTILSPSGVNGIIVEPFDIKSYAEKLSELMKNDDLRKTIQKNAMIKVQEYSVENVGKQWLDLLKKLEC